MRTLPVDDQIRIVSSLGYRGIELVCIPDSTTDVAALDGAERRRIRGLLDAAGLQLPSIAGHADVLEPDSERLAANLGRVRAAFDLAADLAGPEGPPCVVLMGYGQPESYELQRETIAERFSGLAEDAARRGVAIGFEFHVGQAIDRPERIHWLLDRVNHPSFKLNLDVSHLDVMGYSISDSVRGLVEHSVHTHVKDQRGRYPNHEYLTPGEGDYDYVTYLREMRDGGYRGFITVEISVFVQRKPGYDPVEVAARSYRVLTEAFDRAGIAVEA
jgi:sugar phosphate isomerase/epimerase